MVWVDFITFCLALLRNTNDSVVRFDFVSLNFVLFGDIISWVGIISFWFLLSKDIIAGVVVISFCLTLSKVTIVSVGVISFRFALYRVNVVWIGVVSLCFWLPADIMDSVVVVSLCFALYQVIVAGIPWVGLVSPVSHLAPAYPGRQLHVKLLMPSTHAPPFWQGFGEQSSISTREQFVNAVKNTQMQITNSTSPVSITWSSYQMRKIAGAHAPGMPGMFSPPLRVSYPDMHHGTCVAHVPWCMSGLPTSGFLCSRWLGKCSWHSRRMRNPQFYVSGKRTILCSSECSEGDTEDNVEKKNMNLKKQYTTHSKLWKRGSCA